MAVDDAMTSLHPLSRRVCACSHLQALMVFCVLIGCLSVGVDCNDTISPDIEAGLSDKCVQTTVSYILSSYQNKFTGDRVEDVTSIIQSIYLPCINYANEKKQLISVLAPRNNFTEFVMSKATQYMARFPLVVHISQTRLSDSRQSQNGSLPPSDLTVSAIAGGYSTWSSDSAPIGKAIADNMCMPDLTHLIEADPSYDLSGMPAFFKNHMVSFNSSVAAVPVSGPMLHLYYRRDVFSSRNISVPDTWEELLELAVQLNGTDIDGDGKPDLPICSAFLSGCRAVEGYVAVLGSYTQYLGTKQGAFINGDAMESLLDTPGSRRALQVFTKLARVASQAKVSNCSVFEESLFARGKCIMALGQGMLFKRIKAVAALRGKVGVARLPGSNQVYVHKQQQLVRCTAELCPHASTSANGSLVNRAPFSPWTPSMFLITKDSPPEEQRAAFKFISYVGGDQVSQALVVDPSIEVEPFWDSHLAADLWSKAGYDDDAAAGFLSAATAAIRSENNILPPRFNGSGILLKAIAKAISSHALGSPEDAAISEMNNALKGIIAAGPPEAFASQYKASLNAAVDKKDAPPPHTTPYPSPAPHHPPSTKKSLDVQILVPTVVVPSMVLVLLLGVTLFFTVHVKKDPRRNFLGRVLPPRQGSEITIVVTDVQDATMLWEQLPHEVMHRTLQLHTTCLRRLLRKNCGYESLCKDDGFLLAFHNTKDALRFCVDLQMEMMAMPWPEELLQHELCKPFYIKYLESVLEGSVHAIEEEDDKDDDEDEHSAKYEPPSAPVRNSIDKRRPGKPPHTAVAHVAIDVGVADEGSPNVKCFTFRKACRVTWQAATGPGPGNVLAFRGLRVRTGMHSGMDKHDEVIESFDKKTQYRGPSVSLAHSICHCTAAGISTLSEATYRQLPMEDLWDTVMVLHAGEHELPDTVGAVNLYKIIHRQLRGRLAHLPGLASCRQLSLGAVDAPLGQITIVFMNIVGVQALLAWNVDVAQRAVAMFHTAVAGLLQRFNGYQVEATDSLLLASFHHPVDAVLWCLESQRRLLKVSWPKELLQHELGEEVVVAMPMENGKLLERLVLRGLRIKAGVDVSDAKGSVHAITGKITYRGKVMNRAARIGVTATAGQILCSADVWTHATRVEDGRLRSVESACMGSFALRGVSEKIQVHQIRFKLPKDQPAIRRFSEFINLSFNEADALELMGPGGPAGAGSAKASPSSPFRPRALGTYHSITPRKSTAPRLSDGGSAAPHPRPARAVSRRHSTTVFHPSTPVEASLDVGGAEMDGTGGRDKDGRERSRRGSRRAMERLSQLMSPADLDTFLARLSEGQAPGAG